GVSGLLQGDKSALVPEGNERMARRRQLNVIDPGYEAGCREPVEPVGDGAALRPIIPLPMKSGNGHAAKNGGGNQLSASGGRQPPFCVWWRPPEPASRVQP